LRENFISGRTSGPPPIPVSEEVPPEIAGKHGAEAGKHARGKVIITTCKK